MNLKLSIIIPIYNREDTITETLLSILHQSTNPFNYEIIIVDDGSTDQSVNVCQILAEQFPQIIILTQPNAGCGGARNKGLSHAQGEYVWFVDGDDWIDNNAFSILNPYLDGFVDAVIFAGADIIDGNRKRRFSLKSFRDCQLTGKQFIDQSIRVNFFSFSFRFVNMWLTIFKRSFLTENLLFMKANIYHEDLEFMPRAFFFMQRLSFLDDILYLVRQTPGSITRTANEKKAFDYLSVAKSLTGFIKSHPSSNSRKLWVIPGVAICNSFFEIWRSGKQDDDNYIRELQLHSDIYINALKNSFHAKFILMALLFQWSPSFLIWFYNKILIKL